MYKKGATVFDERPFFYDEILRASDLILVHVFLYEVYELLAELISLTSTDALAVLQFGNTDRVKD